MNYKDIAKRILIELAGTFSNKKSFLSSKRIERFLAFTNMLVLTNIFVLRTLERNALTTIDFMIIVGGWLSYVGFIIVKSRQDQDKDKSDIVG